MSLREAIVEELTGLGTSFRPSELAFLSLTSKIERPVQNQLAFALYLRLWPEAVVSREHPSRTGIRAQTDIAVLDPQTGLPKALREVNALYTFDSARVRVPYVNAVAADLRKAQEQAVDGTEVFALALVVHPLAVPRLPYGVMKYEGSVVAALARYRSADALRELADANLRAGLGTLGPVTPGAFPVGEAFGAEVEALYYLVGPVSQGQAGASGDRSP